MNSELATVIINWHLDRAIETVTLQEAPRSYDEDGDMIITDDSICNQYGELINIDDILTRFDLSADDNVIARIDYDINNQDDDSMIAQSLIEKYNDEKDLYIIEVHFDEGDYYYKFLVQ